MKEYDILPGIAGRRYGVINPISPHVAEHIDTLIERNVDQITIRKHKATDGFFVELAETRLRMHGWQQWGMDNNVWIKGAGQ